MTSTLRLPCSGRLLTAQLAAYGLGLALRADDHSAWIGHADSPDCDPVIETDASLEQVAHSVVRSALDCEGAVEADLVAGQTGNDRIPVIRARATDPDRAVAAVAARERLLDAAETDDDWLVAAVLAGLGAPAPWLHHRAAARTPTPARGATQLDGVPYNIGSDIVRALLRPMLHTTTQMESGELAGLFANEAVIASPERDRSRWSPAGTKLAPACQWLAAVGLGLLPVGLRLDGRARTPGFWRGHESRGITLPVLEHPASVPRLRAILERPELTAADDPRNAARLRALGVTEILHFSVLDAASDTMVAFSFATATRQAL